MDVDTITAFRDCEVCRRKERARLVRDISQSGVSMAYWYCTLGQHPIKINGRYIQHEKIRNAGYDPERLPVINNYSGNELCAICGSPFTQYHHWAPKHLFHEDADLWPGAYLCDFHHKTWHNVVTPEMCEARRT